MAWFKFRHNAAITWSHPREKQTWLLHYSSWVELSWSDVTHVQQIKRVGTSKLLKAFCMLWLLNLFNGFQIKLCRFRRKNILFLPTMLSFKTLFSINFRFYWHFLFSAYQVYCYNECFSSRTQEWITSITWIILIMYNG